MTKFLCLLLCVLLGASAFAEVPVNVDPGKPGLPTTDHVRDYLSLGYGFDPQLGVQVTDHKLQLAKGMWSVVANGGASVVVTPGPANGTPSSTVLANLKDVDGKDLQLPFHSIIKQVTVDVIAPLVGSSDPIFGSPVLGLGIDAPADLLAYTAAASWSGRMAGIPVGTAATMHKVGLGKADHDLNKQGSTVKLNMKGGSVVKGQLDVFIEYYLSD